MTNNDFLQKTSEELSIDIDKIKKVVDFMWRENKKAFRTPATTVEIPDLGYFKINKSKIVNDMKRYRKFNDPSKSSYFDDKIKLMLVKDISHPEWSVGLDNTQE